MIHLTYSNQTEQLLARLVENLGQRRASPLEPVPLVVPNASVETFVKLGLARATGIAANLEVRFLRRFVVELLERARPEVEMLDAARLSGLLLSLLHDEALVADAELDEVKRYLGAAGSSADALDLRRFQLARQLALLFDEYALSRPEMLDAWQRGQVVCGDAFAGTERWQKRLWRELSARLARREGKRWLTLHQAFAGPPKIDPRKLGLPPELHLFGISYVARVFQGVLQALAAATELHVYTLNPCMEYWEDVPRGVPLDALRQAQDERGDDPFGLERAGDTPALRLWARPGRENVRLLNELSECDFTPKFADPTASRASLLALLQRDILTREPERAARLDVPADGSIQLLACPGVRREVEIIAAEIWKLMHADPSLRFNDVAVILPASHKETYQTHVQAVFRETHDLPHSVVDLPLAAQSRVVEAIELLLELPLGEFRRQEVLRLATHPAVMKRFSDVAPSRDEWIAWTESLGIVHGADHGDHAGTYITRDILNWDQGMRRLALGAFMSGGGERLDARAYQLDGEAYLPEEVLAGRVPSAASFGLLVRSLIADARFARNARLTLPQWVRFLRGLLSSYLAPTGDEDDRAIKRCHDAIESLERIDLEGRTVSYRIACELARTAMGALQGSRGQYLAGGVVVASFLPMRAIPFRVVFVAGLGEGQFPSSDRKNNLDLRLARRRPGDVSPREQDKYMFLETLLCARERFYLSYVSRESLTGEKLAPSSVVVELMQMLDRGYLDRRSLVREFPLRRHLDDHTRFASLPAEREARAEALGEHLRRHADGPQPSLDQLRRELPAPLALQVIERLGLTPPPPPTVTGSEAINLPLTAIRRFLECPLQGAARYQLGMRDEDDEDLTAREDEPFETTKLELMIGLRELFLRTVALGDDALEAGYRQLQNAGALSGAMPSGLFGDAERPAHLTILRGWREMLREIGGLSAPPVRIWRFGAAEEHARVDALDDAITVELELPRRAVTVKLCGKTEPLVESAPGSLILVQRPARAKDAETRLARESLKGFLDAVVLAAAGRPSPVGWNAFVANVDLVDGPVLTRVPFAPITTEQARDWLRLVLEDLIGGVHDYCLPCEAVFAHAYEPNRAIGEIVEDLRGRRDASFSSRFGPVPRGQDRPAPDEQAAQRMIERRFGLFFARRGAP
jgi:exodeoxyribonuclease V gamma subunit